MKQSPCCARATAKVRHEKAELSRLARLAARCLDPGRLQAQIIQQRKRIEDAQQVLVDHEAAHAAEPRACA